MSRLANSEPVVYLNGSYVPLSQATISVMDGGFLFSDGVYEVIPIYSSNDHDERPLFLSDYFDRLQKSLAKISINCQLSQLDLLTIIKKLLAHNVSNELGVGIYRYVYLQITRGAFATRSYHSGSGLATIFVKLENINPQLFKPCIEAMTMEETRWYYRDIKTINKLANVLMYQKAREMGVDEVIIIDHHHYALEGATTNLFIVEKDVVITPPSSAKNLLMGVARYHTMRLVKKKFICVEENITKERLLAADEVWLTSSTRKIAAVVQIDKQLIGNGKLGRITQIVQHDYDQYIASVH